MSSLGEGITHFAVDLFQQIRQSKKENVFYSPLSIMSAFGMTSLGARGHTASEIQKVGRSFLYTYPFVLVSLSASVQMITDLAVPRGSTGSCKPPQDWAGTELWEHMLSPSSPPHLFPVPRLPLGAGMNPTTAQ